jgi:cytochrome bd-I ubiquinol oxidase subunit X
MTMWYFTWILGIGVALAFGIINVMLLEARLESDAARKAKGSHR